MKRMFVLGICLGLFSCHKKEIELPKANETIIADVPDHSAVDFLFKIQGEDTLVAVTGSNAVGAANLLFAIDKRLPLRKVILEIKKLQPERHKIKGAENYFVYSDTMQKSNAYLPFTKVQYKLEKPDFNVVYFYLDRNDLVHFKDEVFSKNELQAFLDKKSIRGSAIVFSYDKGMSFGKYMQYQFFVKHLVAPNGVTINSRREYIY